MPLLKHSLIYLFLSIVVVVFARYVHLLTVYIDMVFIYVNYHLTPFFDTYGWQLVLRKVLILVGIPLALGGLSALAYKLIKKQNMPHLLPVVWVLWTVMVLSDILIR